MKKWIAALSVMFALAICLFMLPADVNAEAVEPAVSIEVLESILNGSGEIDPNIGSDSYDIDGNGIVEYDDLVALKYLLGEGAPLADPLLPGKGEDLLSTLDLSLLQTALVRGDSTRALVLNKDATSVTVMFGETVDLSQSVYFLMDALCLNGKENLTLTFHTASGDMQPISIGSQMSGWSTVSVYLPAIPVEELAQINGFTILLDSENTVVIDNVCIDGTAERVQVTFYDVNETITFAAGYPYGKMPVPSKEGYIFNGWYDNADCTGTRVTSETLVPAEGQTLYAGWVASRETKIDFSTDALRESQTSAEQVWKNGRVTFTNTKTTASNNVSDDTNPIRLYKGSTVTVACTGMGKIVLTSYNGNEYITALSDTLDEVGACYTVSDNIFTIAFNELVDVFEIPALTDQVRLLAITVSTVDDGTIEDYEVAFNLNYPDAPEGPASLLVEEGCAYVTLPDVTRDGYIFGGWYLNPECTGDAVTARNTVNSAHSLYAKWTAVYNEATKDITIDFTSAGHRLSQTTSEQVWANGGVTLTNSKASATSNVVADFNPVKFYAHSALKIEATGITKIVFTGDTTSYATPLVDSITSSADVGVAQTEKVVTVTFSNPVDVFVIGDIVKQVRLDSVTVTVADDGSTPDTPKYEVTFNLNYSDAPEAPASLQIEEGSVYGTLPLVSRDGYIFGGWYLTADCTGDAVTESTAVTSAHTLYAKWTAAYNAGATKDVTIDFTTTDHRVSQSEQEQVWANDGVTMTNTKASAQSNVADACNPAKFYAHSALKIEAAGITKIVFTGDTPSYATPLVNSITSSADIGVVQDGKIVTVTFTNPVDVFEVGDISAQVRLDGITVTVADNGTAPEPPVTEPPATEPTPEPTPEPTDPPVVEETVEHTITFDDKAKRTEFSTTKQVWVEDGITVTNNKAAASSNVADFANPVRFYKNSEIIIASKGMTKIVITANNTSYANTLAGALSTTASGSTVTITFDTPVDSYTIIPSTGAVWLLSMTVTTVVSGGAEEPDPGEDPETFEVSFDLNYQGAPAAPATLEVTKGDAYGELPIAERTGYTFDGWFLDAEGNSTAVKATDVVDESRTLYAKWTAIAEPAPDPDPEPEITYVPKDITITFDAGKTNRTEYSTAKQVWVKDGLTFTNEKSASTTNVGDYSNPVRIYAKSSVLIECGNMSQIIIVSDGSSSYKTALTNSLNNAGVQFTTGSSNTYTITFDVPVNSFSIPSFTAQARFKSITVTALVPETSSGTTPPADEPSENDPPVNNDPAVDSANPIAVVYTMRSNDKYTDVILNWGYRGDTASGLSPNALAFYTARNTSLSQLSALSGSATLNSVPQSDLYLELKAMMSDAHTTKTTYDDVRYLFGFTDCQGANDANLSLLYCGENISAAWDGGTSFNREHCWPKSKTAGSSGTTTVDADIMTLRPATPSNNGSRSDKAFGTTTTASYFNPNEYLKNKYDIRGDMARTVLYTYVRWGEGNLTGADGAIESIDVLLDWIEEDPVDTWELGRNDSVESITGTRNIFVDYPELAFVLFGEQIPTNMQTPSKAA